MTPFDEHFDPADIGEKTSVRRFMRMTYRFPGHRTFSTNHATQSHTLSPLKKLNAVILPDSVDRSKIYPLQFLKGVGPVRAEILAKMGIREPEDLLTTFPP